MTPEKEQMQELSYLLTEMIGHLEHAVLIANEVYDKLMTEETPNEHTKS